MARLRPALWLVLLGLLGCHHQDVLPAPEAPDLLSALLFTIDESEVRAAHATALDGPGLLLRDPGELFGVFFTCPLERLGLEPGPLALAAAASPTPRVPSPAYTARLSDEGWGEAAPPAAVQDALRRLPIPEDAPCVFGAARLEGEISGAPADARFLPAFAVALGDGTGLVAAREGLYYRVASSGRVDTLPPLLEAAPLAAYAAPDGALWLLDVEGTLWSGRLDGPLRAVAADPTRFRPGDTAAMTGPDQPDAPFELFVAVRRDLPGEGRRQRRTFLRYSGDAWQPVSTATVADETGLFIPRVTWLGPGRAATYGANRRNAVVLYDDGGVRVLPPPGSNADQTVSGLGTAADGGLLAGTDRGVAHGWDGLRWTRLADPGFERLLTELWPRPGGGLILGGLRSLLGLRYEFATWHPTSGGCASQQLSGAVLEMIRLDAETYALVTISTFLSPQAFDIELLRVTVPRARCSGD